MAKGWKLIGTINVVYDDGRTETERRRDRMKAQKNFDSVMRKMKIEKDLAALKKDGDDAYAAREAANAELLQAYEEKKLKSKALIRKARILKRKKERAKNKKNESIAQPQSA